MIGGDKIWANTNELTGKPYTIYSLEEFVAIGTAWDPIKELRFDAATKTTGQTSTTNLRKRLLNEPILLTDLPFDSVKGLTPFAKIQEFPTSAIDPMANLVAASGVAVAKMMAEMDAGAVTDSGILDNIVNKLFIGKAEKAESNDANTNTNTKPINPDNQSALIGLVHGLHALILSRGGFENSAPTLCKTTIPTRYQWVVDQLSTVKEGDTEIFGLPRSTWQQLVTDIQDSYDVRREDVRIEFNQLVKKLLAPKALLRDYVKAPPTEAENDSRSEVTKDAFDTMSLPTIFDVFRPQGKKPAGK